MKGLSAAQRKKLCLSAETLEGLRITGKLMHTNIITTYSIIIMIMILYSELILCTGTYSFEKLQLLHFK